jgi:hypothetical protein
VRRIALGATIFAAIWTAALLLFGGFDLDVSGLRVTSNAPMRPFLWGSVAFALFVWANGAQATFDACARGCARLDPRLVVVALALWATGTTIADGTTAGFGADSYGYVSQAELWLDGHLKQAEPWAEQAPWPRAAWTFAPLGYRPPVGDESRGELIPTYSPGLPMAMALVKRVAGHCAMFGIVPVMAGLLVWATFGLGRRLASPGAGVLAAWLVATSPAVILAALRPMTDVPVAALWTMAFVVALGRGWWSAIGAGLLAGIAILIRPNLVVLAAVLGLWFVIRRSDRLPGRPLSRLVHLAAFAAGLAPGVVATCVIFNSLYGSPFVSGYGSFNQQFAWANVGPNITNYTAWLIESQTVLSLMGVGAILVPLRRLWPAVPDRRVFWIMGIFSAVLWAQFCFYLVFEDWGFLRFLLPFWPLLMLGLGAVALAVVSIRRPVVAMIAVWVILAVGVRGRSFLLERGMMNLWPGDSAYVGAALAVRSITEPNSVVFTWLHSGSVRYYAGRVTMRYDLLDRDWLDRAVEWLNARGVAVYALLDRASIDAYDSEVEYFVQRFAGQRTVDRLDGSLIYTYGGPRPIYLYALSTPQRSAAPQPDSSVNDPAYLSCVPPAPRGQLQLK